MRVPNLAAVTAALALVLSAIACSAGGAPASDTHASDSPAAGAAHAASGAPTVTVGQVKDISGTSCAPNDAEVEAASWRQAVYAAWICEPRGGLLIGFARSADGGKTWSAPLVMPGSKGGWDPAVSVAPDGTLYVSYMDSGGGYSFPVVEVSHDQGRTFPQRTEVLPPASGNWGDRDFIAAGAHGVVYLTWDYAPTNKYLKIICPPGGSCAFTAGELNAVFQKSTDYGRTWGPITHLSPGFPASGADLAPLIVAPGGRVDVLYQDLTYTNRKTLTLGPAHVYFTSSGDGGRTWTAPRRIGGSTGAITGAVWWIDGAISADSAGNLYATWDTQVRGRDTGWLSYSADAGEAWSAPVRVTPDNTGAPHITQSAGGPPGTAYVGWLSASSSRGYAQYLRVYRIGRGWLDAPVRVSPVFGVKGLWPGDTFGITTLPGLRSLVLAWGSAVSAGSQIFAAPVSFLSRVLTPRRARPPRLRSPRAATRQPPRSSSPSARTATRARP